MVEGARLEIVWAEMSRRFESSRFRQNKSPILAVFLVRPIVNRASLEETTNLGDFILALGMKNPAAFSSRCWPGCC